MVDEYKHRISMLHKGTDPNVAIKLSKVSTYERSVICIKENKKTYKIVSIQCTKEY